MTRRIRVLCGLLPVLAFTAVATAGPSVASANDASTIRALAPYKTSLTVDIIYLVSQRNPPSIKQARSIDGKLAGIQRDLGKVLGLARRQRPSSKNVRNALGTIERALSYVNAAAGLDRAAVRYVQHHNIRAARTAIRSATTDLTRAIPLLQSGGKALHLFG